MRFYIISLVIFFLLVRLASGDESDFISKYLDGQIELPSGADWRQYYILTAKDDTPSQLVALLRNHEKKDQWENAIQALGTLASNPSGDVPLGWITEITESWERSSELNDDEQLNLLEMAYSAVAYEGSTEAFQFLVTRAHEDFWNDKEMPSSVEVMSDPRSERKITARSRALLAIAKHPSAEAEKFSREAYGDPSFGEDYLQAQLESNFRMRSTWLNAHKQRMEAYELNQLEQLPVSEVPAVVEVAEEVSQPEPPAEEPTKVATPEPTEEPTDQSSQWWLWLIGALVVVGGVGLIARRKS